MSKNTQIVTICVPYTPHYYISVFGVCCVWCCLCACVPVYTHHTTKDLTKNKSTKGVRLCAYLLVSECKGTTFFLICKFFHTFFTKK